MQYNRSCKPNATTQDNLQKILHSYSVRLESVDSGQPATREYVAFRNERGEGEIVLQITNSSVQRGRIWNCIVTPATCRDVPLSDNTEISKSDNITTKMLNTQTKYTVHW